uniref:Phosphatidic acid phosphatase type 2/haloperoxidase domain-containing protein n=1 Tax=viral metagenome TaxID=1070528 RepID=A0A6C0HD50_9ZZZZ
MDNIISFSVNFMFLIPLLIYFCNKDIRMLKIFGIGILVTTSVNPLKHIIVKQFPNIDFLYRPQGAFNCDFLNNGGKAGGEPGFPSGHMAVSTYIITSLYLYYNKGLDLGILYILLVAFARINKKCHNIYQVIGGMIYGYSVARYFN